MKLIKSAIVIDPTSKWDGKKVDLLINKGKIEKIAKSIKSDKAEVIKSKKLHISPSWVDIGTQLSEPGYEHRETISETAKCAIKGGFAHLATLPNTLPAADNKASVEFLSKKGKSNNIHIIPLGALSKGSSGEELSEMLDLNQHGCKVFTDGSLHSIDSGLLKRGLLYVKQFNGTILSSALSKELDNRGLIHEGDTSVKLGIRGIPAMAEFSEVSRQIMLADYTESKLCIHGISTSKGLSMIQQASKSSDQISTTVPYLNLLFNDKALESFDTNYKVMPPLRSKTDQNALIKGINNGSIQAIISNHKPYDKEAKDLEFEYAEFGASGLETVFGGLVTHCEKLNLTSLIHALSIGPRNILGIEVPTIEVGQKMDFTLFDPSEEWEYNSTHSSSKNNPFLGSKLRGKVVKVLN